MKVIDPGHKYELDCLDSPDPFILHFVKREGEKYPGNVGSYPGPTMQEVLRALLDRLDYVNGQVPTKENNYVRENMIDALWWLEERHARINNRTLKDMPIKASILLEPTCRVCGHVRCEEHVKEVA